MENIYEVALTLSFSLSSLNPAIRLGPTSILLIGAEGLGRTSLCNELIEENFF